MIAEELASIIDRAKKDRSIHLDLYQQKIGNVPDELGELTDLVSVRLVGNRLTTLPDSIGNLTNLRELRLYKNQLKTLPDSIAKLQKLTCLSLSLNQLKIFPESILSLTNLTALRLNGNQLTVLPANIDRLTNLTYLDISGNPLVDLSVLHSIPKLIKVKFWNVDIPRKYWIDLKSYPHALQLSSGEIVKFARIQNRDLTILNNRSLIRLPENLESELLSLSTKVDNKSPFPFIVDVGTEGTLCKLKDINITKNNSSHLHLSKNKLTLIPFSIGKLTNLTCLDLRHNQLTSLPASIGNLNKLTHLDLQRNQLTFLPATIDNLTNLTHLYLNRNFLVSIPRGIGELKKLTQLHLGRNLLTSLPESLTEQCELRGLHVNGNSLECLPLNLDRLTKLRRLDISHNKFITLPNNIGKLIELVSLNLSDNQLTVLPPSISSLNNLTDIYLSGNPLTDLSILQQLPKLNFVNFFGVTLPRRYWTKLSEWKAEWLLDEDNAEIRRRLIEQLGYEKICDELDAVQLDVWREYSLLRIDGIERFYGWQMRLRHQEPMVLLKMICPSTKHIHVLRVPPEMTSAEAAITWVNHGIHPDKFIIQT